MNFVRKVSVMMSMVVALGNIAPAQALGVASQDTLLLQRLDALDQEVRTLKRQRELEQEAAAAKKKETPIVGVGQEGFFLNSADGNYLLKLRALNQADSRFFIDEEKDPLINGFFIRRMRFLLEGTLAGSFDFRLMPDFAGGVLVLQDAYADIRLAPEFKARFGKFKTPVGLERLQSPHNILFVERALPTLIAPNRDIGIQLHGGLCAGALNYALGVFNGVRDGGSSDLDIHDNKDYAARLFAQPFIKSELPALEGLGFGVAGSAGNEHGTLAAPALPTYLSPGQFIVFRYLSNGDESGTVVAGGSRLRFSPQTYYSFGPFGFLGEYIESSQEVQKAATRQKLTNKAYQLAGSYVLTGENASYMGVIPRKSFDAEEGTWGAFELALRVHALNIDDKAFPIFANPNNSITEEMAVTIGLNWYLNRNLRLVLNYEQTRFKGGASAGDRSVEKAIFTRVSLSL
jgi:phosphate-selective porin OprO/OprP